MTNFDYINDRILKSQIDGLLDLITNSDLTPKECQLLANSCQKHIKKDSLTVATQTFRQAMSLLMKKKLRKLQTPKTVEVKPIIPTNQITQPIQDPEILEIEPNGTKVYSKKSKFKSILFLVCLGLVLGLLLPKIVLLILCLAGVACFFI